MKFNIETILKVAGVIIAALTFFFGLQQYSVNNEREFRKNYYTLQSTVFNELLNDLGGMSASMEDSSTIPEFATSFKDFKKLYYGELNLYQNDDIAKSADSLFNKIETLVQNNDLSLIKDTGSIRNQVNSIQEDIARLAQKCNRALQQTYEVHLDKF